MTTKAKTTNTKTLFHNSFSTPSKGITEAERIKKYQDELTYNSKIYKTPERCIKCDSKNKKVYYPMCYYCFLKWEKNPSFQVGGIDLKGECLIMSDSDDED